MATAPDGSAQLTESGRGRIGFVFGTRPEAIKLAPVIAACRETPGLEPVVCVTAQHRLLLDQVLEVFGIEPDHDLDLMQEGQSLSGFAARALLAVGEWLDGRALSAVVVQGDTTTTLMASLAAYHRRIAIGHVEAGLRTGRKYEPFPEEMNRRLTGHVADLHFAPTETAAANLRAEGVDPTTIHLTGNPVVDAVSRVRDVVLRDRIPLPVSIPPGDRLVVATLHRRENFGPPLARICLAVRRLVERNPGLRAVVPVHPNPNVRPVVHRALGGIAGIELIDPPGYPTFIALLMASEIVLTDSGGVQEEAPALGKPTLVLRQVTERPEGVDAGSALVVGDDPERIVAEAERLLHDPQRYRERAQPRSPYGDGHAGERIAHVLAERFGAAGAGGSDAGASRHPPVRAGLLGRVAV